MRVFLLGGAGHVGMLTARRLANHHKVSEVMIAGRNVERTRHAASEIGDKASLGEPMRWTQRCWRDA